MFYKYGRFTDDQVKYTVKQMHNDIHKLLLYKDKNVTDIVFNSDDDFYIYFCNLLIRFAGFNELLGNPNDMIMLMSTLESAYTESLQGSDFDFKEYRRLIFDAHGYLTKMFGEVR